VNPYSGTFALVALLAVGCLVLWPIAGPTAAAVAFAAALLVLLFRDRQHIARLLAWLRDPSPESVPQANGIWDDVFAALYRLLRSQHQSRSRLTATLADFQQASAAIPDGLIILDQADRIEWCNPRAEEHFGIQRERDTGQQIAYLVRHPQFTTNLRGRHYGEALTLRQWRGTDLVLSVQIIPYGDRQKLILTRDITELDRVEAMRRDFIANVSHELRTPLTVLLGFLETLTDAGPRDSPLLHRSLPLMLEQTRRMQRLVEDLLALSRLESAGNQLREEPVNVPEIARALYDDALALSNGRHRIRLDLATDAWISGSAGELASAFGNLMTNAVRYTPDGGEVAISWDTRDGQAVFSVRDTGIGVSPEHIPRLTERFYRVDRSRSRETGGTGLGLAIVKHVLNRHQARLEVASEPGRGSRFSAVFPPQRLHGPEAAPAVTESA